MMDSERLLDAQHNGDPLGLNGAMAGMHAENQAQAEAQSLAPRLIKSMQAEYEPACYDPNTGNASGLTPYGPNVLVRMDTCATITSGGVYLPDDMAERMTMASVTGCIYAIGPDAFRGLTDRPQVGQRIYIEKYSGVETRGKDGVLYRVVDEKCVACGIADDLCVAEI